MAFWLFLDFLSLRWPGTFWHVDTLSCLKLFPERNISSDDWKKGSGEMELFFCFGGAGGRCSVLSTHLVGWSFSAFPVPLKYPSLVSTYASAFTSSYSLSHCLSSAQICLWTLPKQRVLSEWPISSVLAPFWRSALWGMERGGSNIIFQSHRPLDLMSYLNIIFCPLYITSPQGKGHAFTCAMENRECCWHLANVECWCCKVLITGRCEWMFWGSRTCGWKWVELPGKATKKSLHR